MIDPSLRNLLEKVDKGLATERDYQELKELINADRSGETIGQIHAFYSGQVDRNPGAKEYDFVFWNEALQEILAVDRNLAVAGRPESGSLVALEAPAPHTIPFLRRIRWVAAAIFFFLGIGTYVWERYKTTPTVPGNPTTALTQDARPGGNRAILTLSGGQQIILDSTANGQVARQGNTRIQKLAGGQLAYERIDEKPSEVLYNTLSTPRGGQYQLTLPDGTKVWLNAASSITYPTVFAGAGREVSITGEAYFEVAKNVSQPFLVKTGGGQTIQVLGTHFNVNTYSDELLSRTTLLEGSVRVSAHGKESVVLQPGEQAQLSIEGASLKGKGNMGDRKINVIRETDPEQVIAWKNGLFVFTDADIPTIMRQLARWYDVDIRYEGEIPKREFNGKIGKTLTLAQVLKVLTTIRVHYRIEGHQLTIQP